MAARSLSSSSKQRGFALGPGDRGLHAIAGVKTLRQSRSVFALTRSLICGFLSDKCEALLQIETTVANVLNHARVLVRMFGI
jgi:hypothetical protein